VDGRDWYYGHARVGQDPGGLVGLERHRVQGKGERVAAMPQPPGRVELEPAAILLGVDHEHPTRTDDQVLEVGSATGEGQVVQDRPPVPLQRAEQPGCASLPRRPPPPGDGLGLGRNRSPHPAATAASPPTTKLSWGASRLPSHTVGP
jgi:hypothetical protein